MVDESAQIERVLADALTSADPWSTLQRALASDELTPGVRAQLKAIDEDGLRISALLVAKLRFERVMNGSSRAADWFQRDPEAFTDAFRRYHTTVAPTELMPGLEGRRFERWLERATECGA